MIDEAPLFYSVGMRDLFALIVRDGPGRVSRRLLYWDLEEVFGCASSFCFGKGVVCPLLGYFLFGFGEGCCLCFWTNSRFFVLDTVVLGEVD